MSLAEGLQVETEMDPSLQPFLYDHKIDDTAVLPGVMAMEAFAEMASLMYPERVLVAAENVQFLAPFKFYRDEPQTLLLNAQFETDSGDILAHCRCTSRRQLHGRDEPRLSTHFLATIRLATEDVAGGSEALPEQSGNPAVSAAELYQIYFHGPAYQVLSAVYQAGDEVIGAMAVELPDGHASADSELIARPRLVELCFQTAGAWEIGTTGQMGLPHRIDRVRFFSTGQTPTGDWYALARPVGDGEQFDAVVVDGTGQIYVSLEGYRSISFPGGIDEKLLLPLKNAMN